MNRAKRRLPSKKTGIEKEMIDRFFGANKPPAPALKDGQKVRLNYSAIVDRKDYPRMSERYRAFVEAHKDDVFTVEYEEGRDNNALVCLAEDPSEVKWLWWTGDLIPLNEQ